MKILIVGSGAREHALCARLAAEAEVICAPGNPGIARVARTAPADLSQPQELLSLAEREQIDLTVVGPELPLARGVADLFAAQGRPLFGPTRGAARLESSKAFAKAFMARHRVPTARFHISESLDDALKVVRRRDLGLPVVVKADGLAAGKGVVLAHDETAAESAVIAAMRDRRFGEAGERLVIEECLDGPEISFFAVSDGRAALAIGSAQDHKRAFDEDRGPNTGGMGAFAPSPLVDAALHAAIMRRIVDPVVSGMAVEGHAFRGFLYAGLMLTADGPKVIEFNVRLGDPEAQVLLPLIEEPLLPMLADAASGALARTTCRLRGDRLVGVVLASRGYPDSHEAGRPIAGLDAAEELPGVSIYHAGTALRDGRIVTAGGRVLTVVGRGPDFPGAAARAYDAISCISFDGMHYRRDIAQKAAERELQNCRMAGWQDGRIDSEGRLGQVGENPE